ncbi:MAG TPA: helix-turn-helix transcriptional regulator [Candidatus Eisenbacteria bacterium]|nr:helix-turn-helix transcriptional regulator [Candidatus Eisenbacteria bacterium]
MNTARKTRLARAGWRVGTAEEFLNLSREEAELVELKLALSTFLRRHRARKKLTQKALAAKLGSSQSRVAKLESGARGITLDLLFRALFATGLTTGGILRAMRRRAA